LISNTFSKKLNFETKSASKGGGAKGAEAPFSQVKVEKKD